MTPGSFRSVALAVGWTLLIIVLLSLPGGSLPESDLLGYDKVAHAFLFAVGTWLWLQVPRSSRLARWAIVGAALLFAPVSEWYQELLGHGRISDPLDVLADIAGVVIGVSGWFFVHRESGTDRSADP